jgi:hypothetical protein
MSALTTTSIQKIEELLITGNLAQFTNQERVSYVNKVCETLGINPLTRPFEFITFQGKMVMYAKKDCTDQLRKVHGVSVKVAKQEILDGLLFITVEASDKTGRIDSDVGVLNIAGLKGDALANASMKCLTKAKRRVTLSICGLGILDESEIEASQGAYVPESNTASLPVAEDFQNLRERLVVAGKSEKALIDSLRPQFPGIPESIENFNSAQIAVAKGRIEGLIKKLEEAKL